MPPGLNPVHILVILVVALIVLGPHRLPEAARQVGRAMAEFRRWSDSLQSELRDVLDVDTGSQESAAAPVVATEPTAELPPAGPSPELPPAGPVASPPPAIPPPSSPPPE
ncbi:MAG: Sec-independent protein translocase subunit TatA/TatB [Acidimicrobiales bacterium]